MGDIHLRFSPLVQAMGAFLNLWSRGGKGNARKTIQTPFCVYCILIFQHLTLPRTNFAHVEHFGLCVHSLDPRLGSFGASGRPCGSLGCPLWLIWGHLGSLGDALGSLGCPLGYLGIPWGSLWHHLGVSWGSLEKTLRGLSARTQQILKNISFFGPHFEPHL